MTIPSDISTKPPDYSKAGLISFGLAAGNILLTIGLTLISFIPESGSYAQIRVSQIYSVFGFIIAPILYLTNLILGIVGAFKKDSKKIFSILGIVFNAVAVAIIVFYWLIILLLLYVIANTVWR